MIKVLFIVDGSILNPILNSQGFPLLEFLTDKNFSLIVFSVEKKDIPEEKENFLKLKRSHPRIRFYCLFEVQQKILPGWAVNIFKIVKEVRHILKENNVNIIHGRSLLPSIIGYFLKIMTNNKIKLIYDNRGLRIEEEILTGHWNRNSIKTHIFKWLERKLSLAADAIVVVSENFKYYLATAYSKNIADKLVVVPNRTKIQDSRIDYTYKMKINPPILVYSGSAAKWQSLDELVIVLRAALEIFKDIKILFLTYNIQEFKTVFTLSDELTKYVTFKKVSQDEVFGELSKCNIGILIRHNDIINNVSSPLKFAEYLSAGLPVLISEGVGDTENIVKNNKIGAVIKNGDYIKALSELKNLLNDPQIYNRCRETAEREFNIKTSFEQYLNIYQNLSGNE